ncbi:MAG: ATP-grasp domain-containing protein [Oscillospiraceae bacterium]|nr:ATP-grasp domain-containing protein [Oscillospiraceae bacterium]
MENQSTSIKKVGTILFPSSYFNDKEIDEDLKSEYDAVIGTGLFDVVLFSYDKWFNENRLHLNKLVDDMCTAVCRGWMMKPELYTDFYEQLLSKNIQLITQPLKYRLFHIFPHIYPNLMEDTARMIIYPDAESIQLEEIKRKFSKFMVKDFVKSVKGTDFPQFFDSSITESEFQKYMEIFFKYRGELYTGGICIKEFLPLKHYGANTNEYRVFYINNNIASVSRNSGQAIHTPMPPQELIEKYCNLQSPYYTIDYAELENGSWKIIEAGDGQVSGLSDGQDMNAYFRSLYMAFD